MGNSTMGSPWDLQSIVNYCNDDQLPKLSLGDTIALNRIYGKAFLARSDNLRWKGDFDRDGKEDLVITHLNEESALLHNQTQTDHHWLQLQLVGVQSERDAIGAKVTVQFAGQTLTNWVTAGDGYLCKNHNVICFGLGDASQVDNIRIQWPSGSQQELKIETVNQRIVIVENLAQTHSFTN